MKLKAHVGLPASKARMKELSFKVTESKTKIESDVWSSQERVSKTMTPRSLPDYFTRAEWEGEGGGSGGCRANWEPKLGWRVFRKLSCEAQTSDSIFVFDSVTLKLSSFIWTFEAESPTWALIFFSTFVPFFTGTTCCLLFGSHSGSYFFSTEHFWDIIVVSFFKYTHSDKAIISNCLLLYFAQQCSFIVFQLCAGVYDTFPGLTRGSNRTLQRFPDYSASWMMIEWKVPGNRTLNERWMEVATKSRKGRLGRNFITQDKDVICCLFFYYYLLSIAKPSITTAEKHLNTSDGTSAITKSTINFPLSNKSWHFSVCNHRMSNPQ